MSQHWLSCCTLTRWFWALTDSVRKCRATTWFWVVMKQSRLCVSWYSGREFFMKLGLAVSLKFAIDLTDNRGDLVTLTVLVVGQVTASAMTWCQQFACFAKCRIYDRCIASSLVWVRCAFQRSLILRSPQWFLYDSDGVCDCVYFVLLLKLVMVISFLLKFVRLRLDLVIDCMTVMVRGYPSAWWLRVIAFDII